MNKKISTALLSVFYKDGLEPLARQLHAQGAVLYSTGGTQKFLEDLGLPVTPVESLTSYPAILGGRVKTLHPSVFGGILGRRANASDVQEMAEHRIPVIDLVVVDLYPFEETLAATTEEQAIIEKIDIGGPSMIRAAAKNFADVAVVAAKEDYAPLVELLQNQHGETTLEQRRALAAKAFRVVAGYDIAINNYFNDAAPLTVVGAGPETVLRYGENPHQPASFFGNLVDNFSQLHGKELSYNNLVDVDAALELVKEFGRPPQTPLVEGLSGAQPSLGGDSAQNTIPSQTGPHSVHAFPSKGEETSAVFAIIKHTNVCGIAARGSVSEAWTDALAGDPESAFGGILITNGTVDLATAQKINEIFFEVLLAPAFDEDALAILKGKKNRILLQLNSLRTTAQVYRNAVNGTLVQAKDSGGEERWEEAGGRPSTNEEKTDLQFANIVCKHLKSNAIALVKNRQLVGKGCGQTSRIDALRQAVEKARQFNFNLNGAVLASDAFFPFDDCVRLGHEAGIAAFIQPGGSIRDKDSVAYCQAHNLAMVLTGMRHFRH